MALELSSSFTFSKTGKSIFVKDATGEYNATTNPTGWGTPNQNLNESCLVCLVSRKDSGGDQISGPISPSAHFVYDALATNATEKSFEIEWINDGVVDVVLVRLPVTLDGTNYVDTGVVTEGDFYYYNGDVYQFVDSVGVLVEDWSVLITEGGLIRDICNDVATPMLAIKAQEIYKQYVDEREKDPDDALPILQEFQKLQADIQGLYYTFWSGLTVQAQNQIEDLLDKYEIVNNY
jgi:hypothetical protein